MDNIRLILLFSPKESENAMKKRVYTLYRASTKGQVEKDDIPMQKEACRNFAESQGWEIVKEFSEKGVSGFKNLPKSVTNSRKFNRLRWRASLTSCWCSCLTVSVAVMMKRPLSWNGSRSRALRSARHTGGRSKRCTGNPGKVARAGTGRIRRSHQNNKA